MFKLVQYSSVRLAITHLSCECNNWKELSDILVSCQQCINVENTLWSTVFIGLHIRKCWYVKYVLFFLLSSFCFFVVMFFLFPGISETEETMTDLS